MRFWMCGAALSAALVGTTALAVQADAGGLGLTGLHKQAQVGNKLCFVDHLHHGDSGPWETREQAVAGAARSWGSFTAFEYGSDWAEFALAHDQKMNCSQSDASRGGKVWSCKAEAKPCQTLGAGIAVAAPLVHAPVAAAHVVAAPIVRPASIRTAPVASYRLRGHWHGHRHARPVAAPPAHGPQLVPAALPVAQPVPVHAQTHGPVSTWPGDRR